MEELGLKPRLGLQILCPSTHAHGKFTWWMRRSCRELPASLTAGTPSLSVWPLVFHNLPMWRKLPVGGQGWYCPYLELLSLKLGLLLQNMFILVSSPSWRPDQCEPRAQQLQLSTMGQAGQGRTRRKTRDSGDGMQEGMSSLPRFYTRCPTLGQPPLGVSLWVLGERSSHSSYSLGKTDLSLKSRQF